MSKYKKTRKKLQQIETVQEYRIHYLFAVPGIFMCLLTLLILSMDVVVPGMADDQYDVYPSFFRMINWLIAACGVGYWIYLIRLKQKRSFTFANRAATICFALFLLCIVISTVVNGFDEKALHGVSFRNIGIFHIFAFAMIYMFLSSKISRERFRNMIVISFVAVSDALALSVLINLPLKFISAFENKKDLSAIFFNGNHYGYFLVMAILLAAGLFVWHDSRIVRVLGIFSMLLNSGLLLLNGSVGCILSVFLTLVVVFILSFVFWKESVKRLAFIFGFILLGVLTGFILADGLRNDFLSLADDIHRMLFADVSGSAGHNRWLLWQTTWEYIKQKPLLGYGCEGLDIPLLADTGRGNPHNEILNYAGQFGIPAACLYVAGVISTLVHAVNNHTSAAQKDAFMAASGYFISSMFGVPMFYTLPFFFIFLGIAGSAVPMVTGRTHF